MWTSRPHRCSGPDVDFFSPAKGALVPVQLLKHTGAWIAGLRTLLNLHAVCQLCFLHLQARLASSGAAVAAWLDAPPDALPRVLHFEALEGLQKQGGGAVGQAELARLRSQLADPGHMSQPGGGTAGAATAGMVAAWAPAAGAAAPAAAAGVQAPAAMQLPVAGAGGDQVAQLSMQLQVLSVHVATQAAQFGAVLQQHSCTLQQHAQVQQRHEADILAHGEGLRAQQAVNEQLAGAAAHVTAPAGQQQQQQQLRGLGGGGLPLGMEAADIEG